MAGGGLFKEHALAPSARKLNKARLSENEKAIIAARRNNMLEAGKRYTQRQMKTLGLSEG